MKKIIGFIVGLLFIVAGIFALVDMTTTGNYFSSQKGDIVKENKVIYQEVISKDLTGIVLTKNATFADFYRYEYSQTINNTSFKDNLQEGTYRLFINGCLVDNEVNYTEHTYNAIFAFDVYDERGNLLFDRNLNEISEVNSVQIEITLSENSITINLILCDSLKGKVASYLQDYINNEFKFEFKKVVEDYKLNSDFTLAEIESDNSKNNGISPEGVFRKNEFIQIENYHHNNLVLEYSASNDTKPIIWNYLNNFTLTNIVINGQPVKEFDLRFVVDHYELKFIYEDKTTLRVEYSIQIYNNRYGVGNVLDIKFSAKDYELASQSEFWKVTPIENYKYTSDTLVVLLFSNKE